MGTVSVVFALVIITVWLCAKHVSLLYFLIFSSMSSKKNAKRKIKRKETKRKIKNTIMNLAQTNMRTISVSDNDVSSKSSKTSGKSSRWSLFTAYDDNDGRFSCICQYIL